MAATGKGITPQAFHPSFSSFSGKIGALLGKTWSCIRVVVTHCLV